MATSDRRADPAERPAGTFALRVLAAAGLAVDAYVHADLAPAYGSGQQGLFLVAAGAAVAAALLVLAGDRRAAHLVAVLVAASALAAVVTYRYVDPGALGPLPDMYEPVWYPEKVVAAVAEVVAATAAGLLLLADLRRSRVRSKGCPMDLCRVPGVPGGCTARPRRARCRDIGPERERRRAPPGASGAD